MGPRRLALLFVVLSAIPVVALGWLGWRLLQMDETFQAQQQREQLQVATTMGSRTTRTLF